MIKKKCQGRLSAGRKKYIGKLSASKKKYICLGEVVCWSKKIYWGGGMLVKTICQGSAGTQKYARGRLSAGRKNILGGRGVLTWNQLKQEMLMQWASVCHMVE